MSARSLPIDLNSEYQILHEKIAVPDIPESYKNIGTSIDNILNTCSSEEKVSFSVGSFYTYDMFEEVKKCCHHLEGWMFKEISILLQRTKIRFGKVFFKMSISEQRSPRVHCPNASVE